MNANGNLTWRAAALAQVYFTAVLLDISPSMEEPDWPPSRLHGACEEINDLTGTRARLYPNDHMGILSFSGNAEVLRPMVRIGGAKASLQLSVDEITVGSGTNITAALMLAGAILMEAASTTSDAARAGHAPVPGRSGHLLQVILLTDGEHNQDGPAPGPCADLLKAAGIVIEVLGIGTPHDLDETCLRGIASRDADGTIHYAFIGDRRELSAKMKDLSHHYIRPM